MFNNSLSYTEAFAQFGAILKNPQWSVSAFGREGSLVLCLWESELKPGKAPRTTEYSDILSTWRGNDHGRNEIREHLLKAKVDSLPIRLVIAHPDPRDKELVGKVSDESAIKKTFSVKSDWTGTLEEFDGDALFVVFRKTT